MNSKLLGGVLLIVGTSIGAGMLALPIATAQLGFLGSLILLFVCWFVMTTGAFYILEATLWMPLNSNLISMAKATIGPFGQLLAWAMYFLLLYSLLCAYIAGGGDLLSHLITLHGAPISASIAAILFTFIFGCVVYMGIRAVDYVNRGFMFVKLGAYFLLIALLTPFVKTEHLLNGQMSEITSTTAMMVTMTSFGFATIVPSLRIYFGGDVAQLKKAIFLGSTIPLVCYILWDMVMMGIIPLQGEHGLVSILHASDSTSQLVSVLTTTVSQPLVTWLTKLFTSICVVTSFLGVSLCLTDFIADGFQLEKKGQKGLFIHALVFIPPLIIVLIMPSIFIKALSFAGLYSLVLVILLPGWIIWNGRYRRHLAKGFRVWGGKILLISIMLFSTWMLIRGCLDLMTT